jgi:predicted alpha/beta hydrolase family esterase
MQRAKRVIIVHGWGQKPDQEWLPWVAKQLENNGWKAELPEMPEKENPKMAEWLKTLVKLKPDKNTILVGHSLANALIMKYLENKNNLAGGAVMVAAWDWLLEDVKEFHRTFFETGFDYPKIKERKLPISIVNSTNDPWIDFEKSKLLAPKIGAKFTAIENAGHFMAKNGYENFPELLKIINNLPLA